MRYSQRPKQQFNNQRILTLASLFYYMDSAFIPSIGSSLLDATRFSPVIGTALGLSRATTFDQIEETRQDRMLQITNPGLWYEQQLEKIQKYEETISVNS